MYQMDSNVKETDRLSALNVVYVREGSNVIVCKITYRWFANLHEILGSGNCWYTSIGEMRIRTQGFFS